jgi:hypothetical protein
VGQRTRSRAPRHAEAGRRGKTVQDHDDASCDGDLLAEEAEQDREELKGKGPGEAHHVAKEVVAGADALGEMQRQSLFQEARVERDHRRTAVCADHRPEQARQPGETAARRSEYGERHSDVF